MLRVPLLHLLLVTCKAIVEQDVALVWSVCVCGLNVEYTAVARLPEVVHRNIPTQFLVRFCVLLCPGVTNILTGFQCRFVEDNQFSKGLFTECPPLLLQVIVLCKDMSALFTGEGVSDVLFAAATVAFVR